MGRRLPLNYFTDTYIVLRGINSIIAIAWLVLWIQTDILIDDIWSDTPKPTPAVKIAQAQFLYVILTISHGLLAITFCVRRKTMAYIFQFGMRVGAPRWSQLVGPVTIGMTTFLDCLQAVVASYDMVYIRQLLVIKINPSDPLWALYASAQINLYVLIAVLALTALLVAMDFYLIVRIWKAHALLERIITQQSSRLDYGRIDASKTEADAARISSIDAGVRMEDEPEAQHGDENMRLMG